MQNFNEVGAFEPQGELTVQGYPARRVFGVNKTMEGVQHLCSWRNSSEGLPDYWLRVIICDVFRKLLIANTFGRPAAEFIACSAELMVEVVGEGMTEKLDGERVKQGFKLLFRTSSKWPQPADVLKILPNRSRGKACFVPTSEEADVNTTVTGKMLQEILDLLEEKDRGEDI